MRNKRAVEIMYEESQSRVNELTTINVNLSSSRAKIEQELHQLVTDYEEVSKELRVSFHFSSKLNSNRNVIWFIVIVLKISDERYQRVQIELKHTVETLHEEQERVIKIEAIKKSLEIEVKNISVRLEEVEANAIVGGKRIIGKLEARVSTITTMIQLSIEYFTHTNNAPLFF